MREYQYLELIIEKVFYEQVSLYKYTVHVGVSIVKFALCWFPACHYFKT
jgi:hypothetical protein